MSSILGSNLVKAVMSLVLRLSIMLSIVSGSKTRKKEPLTLLELKTGLIAFATACKEDAHLFCICTYS
jgi:hypothetical protein